MYVCTYVHVLYVRTYVNMFTREQVEFQFLECSRNAKDVALIREILLTISNRTSYFLASSMLSARFMYVHVYHK